MKNKSFPSDNRYIVFEDGKVLGVRGKFVKSHLHPTGYLTLRISGKTYKLHRVIAFTFIKNPLNLPDINHKDGNKLNNSAYNLEWTNDSLNNLHAFKIGLKSHLGSKNPRSILSENQIAGIRKRLDLKESGVKLAAEFKVKKSTIYAIKYGLNWKSA